jgi:aryl-alcohol dehydrogenase-like predicted oxidoreductase
MKNSSVATAPRQTSKTHGTGIPICLGGLAFGNHYGPLEQPAALEVISEALSSGVTAFDTSPTYGQGLAEELLSRAIGVIPHGISVSTRLAYPTDNLKPARRKNDRESILRCLEGSLNRLERNRIETYFIEGPDPATPLGETIAAMEELREVGLIRGIGLFCSTMAHLRKALRYGRVDAVMVPYNIFNRPLDPEFLPACREAGIAVHATEPLCRGLLAGNLHKNSVFEEGDVRILDPRFKGAAYRHNIDLVEELRRYASEQTMTLLDLSLGWVLQHPSIGKAVCGARNPQQVREIVAASQSPLTLEQILQVDFIVGTDKHQQA